MSRRRPGVSAGHGHLSWAGKTMKVDPPLPTVHTCQPLPPPAIVRVHHPAVPAPEHKCFRVVRRFTGEEYGEDIGAFQSEGAALLMLARELAWAIVISPNGKRHAFNYQPMTERPA